MAVKPWDLLKKENYTNEEIAQARFDECKKCEFLFQKTNTCKKCGCFMVAKTKLKNATCPIGKWQLWYNSLMPEIISGGFKIPSNTDPANIVTAFTEFSETLAAQIDNSGNPRFSGLLDIDEYAVPQELNLTNTNALVVFNSAVGGSFIIDDTVPVGWNVAVVHLDAANTLGPPSNVTTNWAGNLPAFTIASLVKVSDTAATKYVSTFGDV